MTELIVTLSTIALLTVIAFPYLRKYQPNLKLSATARDLTSDIRYAQQLTVTEQKIHLVAFNLELNKYDILKIDSATTTIKSVVLDPEVRFHNISGLPNNQVIFNYYGGVSDSGQIILANTNNIETTIDIKPSGYVQLEQ